MQSTLSLDGSVVLHAGHGTETSAQAVGGDGTLLAGGLFVLLAVTGLVWLLANRR